MVDCFACCFCFPDDPVEDDPRIQHANRWKVLMKDAPTEETLWCCYGAFCPVCAAYQLRTRALGYNMNNYRCCQGYLQFCCISPGNMGEENCPEFCLCMEVCCCLSCSISATRFMIMDQYSIVSDPCDNRIIRFNNFMQILSCVLNLLSICIEELYVRIFREAAQIVDLIAKIVYMVTFGCMAAQMKSEMEFREKQGQGPNAGSHAPATVEMNRGTGATGGHVQQQHQQQTTIPVVEAKPVNDVERY
ncbi:Hypothetical Protein FCC1311_056892 [Hondaea fermentalgiana]|uniref:Uncharacterized protein n=1 Tax=Hondaea fermentalgiana TaxID=2315210 RepID=A0A2R5GIB4_9STRA|nr:Hypothetical Protein FCC1311_056892 [Hondaea fermentalgiana]|eukprot:GBG29468.1 Hypothetical Protein FCC1311_056892 [Hondaea fermentalgiana]